MSPLVPVLLVLLALSVTGHIWGLFRLRSSEKSSDHATRALASATTTDLALLLRALDVLPVIIFAVDTDSVVRLSLGAFLRSLGLDPGQLVGVRVPDVTERGNAIPPGEDETTILHRVAVSGRPETHVNHHTTGDGSVRYARTDYVPDPMPERGPRFVFGISVDVTHEEQARIDAEQRFSTLRQFVSDDFDTYALGTETRASATSSATSRATRAGQPTTARLTDASV